MSIGKPIISTYRLQTDPCLQYLYKYNNAICIDENVELSTNRELVEEFVNSHPIFHIVMPQAGTVGFLGYEAEINDTMLAQQILKEEGVFFVPGSCFGCEKHLRIGFTCDPETMKTGLAKLLEYLEKK